MSQYQKLNSGKQGELPFAAILREQSYALSFNSSWVYKFTGNSTICWHAKEKGARLTFFPTQTYFFSFISSSFCNQFSSQIAPLFLQTRLFLLLYKWSLHPSGIVFIWISTLKIHIDYFFVLDQEFPLPVPINLWCWVATSAPCPSSSPEWPTPFSTMVWLLVNKVKYDVAIGRLIKSSNHLGFIEKHSTLPFFSFLTSFLTSFLVCSLGNIPFSICRSALNTSCISLQWSFLTNCLGTAFILFMLCEILLEKKFFLGKLKFHEAMNKALLLYFSYFQ